MGIIRELSPSVINQIAAGEVVERPASVVKELLENAIDAGADRIEIAVERGGKDLIRVVDNGKGIAPDDLPLAFRPHATSKLREADDLQRIATLGFRGEALAAIAEISKVCCESRTAEAETGFRLRIDGGRAGAVEPCSCPVGTIMEVRHLFFNTPVRRTFLKSDATEAGHVAEMVTRLALAHPSVHFTSRSSGKVVFDLPATTCLTDRIAALFGRELADQLIGVEHDVPGVGLRGFVSHPSHSRSSSKFQYLFLNGRYVRDRSLQHALAEAYRGLLMVGRYPVAFLNLEVPLDQVDVNVHPTKIEVRFREAHLIYSALYSAIKQAFLKTDLHAKLQTRVTAFQVGSTNVAPALEWPTRASVADWFSVPEEAAGSSVVAPAPCGTSATSEAVDSLRPTRQAWGWSWSGDQAAMSTGTAGVLERNGLDTPLAFGPNQLQASPAPTSTFALRSSEPLARRVDLPFAAESEAEGRRSNSDRVPIRSIPTSTSPPVSASGTGHSTDSTRHASSAGHPRALQFHDSYLVAETPEGLMVIDQHALHERILFEEFKERLERGGVESQRLLIPETVELTPAEAAALTEQLDLLAKLGIELSGFGGSTVLVHALPAQLKHVEADRLVRDLADHLLQRPLPPTPEGLMMDLLNMMACKAAIKAGQKLSPDEIDALLERRHLARDSHHCPHGRPTVLLLTKSDLEKQFGRV